MIEINETKLKNLVEKSKSNIISCEKKIIYINIKNTQEFIISLYKLKSNTKFKIKDIQNELPNDNINKQEKEKVKEKSIANKKSSYKRKAKSAIKRKKQEELLEINPPTN